MRISMKYIFGDKPQKAFCFGAVRPRVSVYDHLICEHNILQTTCCNFSKFTT